jgi:hypothetical protein
MPAVGSPKPALRGENSNNRIEKTPSLVASAEWADKVKTAIQLDDPEIKALYDELLSVRRQIRNYMAHGAFGKRGEAFDFHSTAGAVPVS